MRSTQVFHHFTVEMQEQPSWHLISTHPPVTSQYGMLSAFSFIVVPTKSDSDVMFCLQLLSNTLTCTLHLS